MAIPGSLQLRRALTWPLRRFVGLAVAFPAALHDIRVAKTHTIQMMSVAA